MNLRALIKELQNHVEEYGDPDVEVRVWVAGELHGPTHVGLAIYNEQRVTCVFTDGNPLL